MCDAQRRTSSWCAPGEPRSAAARGAPAPTARGSTRATTAPCSGDAGHDCAAQEQTSAPASNPWRRRAWPGRPGRLRLGTVSAHCVGGWQRWRRGRRGGRCRTAKRPARPAATRPAAREPPPAGCGTARARDARAGRDAGEAADGPSRAWDAAHAAAADDDDDERAGPRAPRRVRARVPGLLRFHRLETAVSGCVADYGRGCRPRSRSGGPLRAAPGPAPAVVPSPRARASGALALGAERRSAAARPPADAGRVRERLGRVTNAAPHLQGRRGAFVRAWLRRLGLYLASSGAASGLGVGVLDRATRPAAGGARDRADVAVRTIAAGGEPPLEGPRTALVVTRKDRGARNWAAVREIVARRLDVVIDHDDTVEGAGAPGRPARPLRARRRDRRAARLGAVRPRGHGARGVRRGVLSGRYLNLCYAAVARKLDRTYRGLLIDAAGDAESRALPGVLDRRSSASERYWGM